MRLEDRLPRTIADQVERVPPPLPDVAVVRRRGRAIRRRRALAVGAVAAVAVSGAFLFVADGGPRLQPEPQRFDPVGQLDYSQGLRAFASPDDDGQISLGGRLFPRKDMSHLDTDATATPYGVVFFDRAAQAHLLDETGRDTTLAPAPTRIHAHFRPSSKADAKMPLVAFTQPGDEEVTVVLHDLRAGRVVDTIRVPCSGSSCREVVVGAVDRGLVFVRTGDGTYVWDHDVTGKTRWTRVGEGEFRVADARNGRILWSHVAPNPASNSPVADWAFTEGDIDAQLSFDGSHVLYWSPTLEPTTPDEQAITLEVKDAIWFTFDTDGSVLAAANGGPSVGVFYDCEIPSGSCTEIGEISTRSGDPMFIGDDM